MNNRIIEPKLRFSEFKENWVKTNFEKLLKYERPDKYIVDNTNYNIEGTPVLTANKAFILGYTDENFGIYTKLPVVIFDDFTVDKKYVDFPFKVKSSAIKILKPKFNDNLKFIYELMRTVKFSADEHKRYYISTYQYIDVFVPQKVEEQNKIAECLNSIDELIAGEEDKLKELKNHKKGLLQKLFPKNNSSNPELRFPEFKEDWVKTNFEKLLKYERPDKYIVDNTNYNIEGTPVLTANKAFILGYTDENFGIYTKLPVIIFDDFTVDKKYVEFPFKVKSSAIKILKPKFNDNLKFIYELMRTVKFSADEHKRYYISTYQYIDVFVPQKIEEQNKIAECLNSIDELISAQTEKIEALKLHKKGLMQGLFPSLEEVKDEQ